MNFCQVRETDRDRSRGITSSLGDVFLSGKGIAAMIVNCGEERDFGIADAEISWY